MERSEYRTVVKEAFDYRAELLSRNMEYGLSRSNYSNWISGIATAGLFMIFARWDSLFVGCTALLFLNLALFVIAVISSGFIRYFTSMLGSGTNRAIHMLTDQSLALRYGKNAGGSFDDDRQLLDLLLDDKLVLGDKYEDYHLTIEGMRYIPVVNELLSWIQHSAAVAGFLILVVRLMLLAT